MFEPTTAPEPQVPIADAMTSQLRPAVRPTRVAGERATGVDVESLYMQYRSFLLAVASRKFGIPDPDAEALLQEVFLSFMQTGAQIDNVRGWLVAAMCNASRHYWRLQGRSEALPEDYLEHSDPVTHSLPERRAMELTVQKALRYLQPRCRETLKLHYFDGRSASEVARELETTTRYAEKLIHNCLKRVREIYMAISRVNR
jgi:RNA polymerase sigma factor (sigma-70 family)